MASGGYGNQSGYGQTNNRYDQPAGNAYGQPAANPYGQPAANPYGQQAASPYGQQAANPYGQQSGNPYSQPQSNPYAAPPRNTYDEEQSIGGRNNHNNNAIPMNNLNGGVAGQGQQKQQDPRAILNECQDLGRGINDIQRDLDRLQRLQDQALNDPDSSSNTETNRQIDIMTSNILAMYENFVRRIQIMNGNPKAQDAINKGQIALVKKNLENSRAAFRTQEHKYESNIREQTVRQFRIVKPNATADDIRQIRETASPGPLFAEALMHSDRRAQSQSTLQTVQGRSDTLQNITKTFEVLNRTFADLNSMIVQQEEPVASIDMAAQNAQENVSQGNTQLDGAITKVRAANRKKWICLGIAILIILIIVIVVVVVVEVLKNK